jgi:hypothetical protein
MRGSPCSSHGHVKANAYHKVDTDVLNADVSKLQALTRLQEGFHSCLIQDDAQAASTMS